MGWPKYNEDNMEIMLERLANMQIKTSEAEIKIVCNTAQPQIVIEVNSTPSCHCEQEEYTDRYIMCKDCGRKVLFTAKAQKHYDKMLWDDPKRCNHCREYRNTRYLMSASLK